MTRARHIELLTMGVSMWTSFFIAGLPSNYFLDWTWPAQLVLIVIVPTIVLFFITHARVVRAPREAVAPITLWTAFYFTAPFLLLDIAYLGLHQHLGATFS